MRCANSLRHVLSENVKNWSEISHLLLLMSAFSFAWSRIALAKILKIAIKLNYERNFNPNVTIMKEYIK